MSCANDNATEHLRDTLKEVNNARDEARASLDAAYSKGRADERDFSRVVEERLTHERNKLRAEVAHLKALHEKADLDRWNALDEVDELRTDLAQMRAAHCDEIERHVDTRRERDDWQRAAKEYESEIIRLRRHLGEIP